MSADIVTTMRVIAIRDIFLIRCFTNVVVYTLAHEVRFAQELVEPPRPSSSAPACPIPESDLTRTFLPVFFPSIFPFKGKYAKVCG